MGERPFGESEPSPSELHFVVGALIAASIALYARPCGAATAYTPQRRPVCFWPRVRPILATDFCSVRSVHSA